MYARDTLEQAPWQISSGVELCKLYIYTRHFSLRSQITEYPKIFRVTGANQNARKKVHKVLIKYSMVEPER